jgi:hypothetical protein
MRRRQRTLGACATTLSAVVLCLPGSASAADACHNAEFRSGPSESLPDCRAYEQVSPIEKGGLDAVTFLAPLSAQSSACEVDETCTLAYMNVGVAFAGSPGNDNPNAYLASRGAEGWATVPLAPPTPQAPPNSVAQIGYAFAGNLSEQVLRVPLQQLTEGAPTGVYNLFLRQPSGAYSLITDRAPSTPPEAGCGYCFERQDVPAFAGGSSDFSHVIFEANDSLVAGAPTGVENLYEAVGGELRLVGILPDGRIDERGATAGGGIKAASEQTHEIAHAISQDGSHVVFEAQAEGDEQDSEQDGMTEVFDRVDGSSTTELSAPGPGAGPLDCEIAGHACNAEPAQFWAASADGSIVYFTSRAALTKASYTGAEPASGPEPRENPGDDLYRYDAADGGSLVDITADAGNAEDPDGADVLGVVGASEDGSYVYFVATGTLGDAAAGAESGGPNLFVWHESGEGTGTISFIARLRAPSKAEEENVEGFGGGEGYKYASDLADWTSRPTESQAYVTPDGGHLAFMSVEPLTGYESDGDHEVFEYSADSGGLVCASCDPHGGPPLGSAFLGARLGARLSSPFHQPRSLSDDGRRLFFTSPDPLVAGLPGGSDKLFEYEEGTAHLISGSEGGGEAVFLDASASGNDVFFATREQLVPTDTDELEDVYDARVDGGFPAPATVAPCQGSACQEPLVSPPTFAAPVSALYNGPESSPPPHADKPTRKQQLAIALAKCRKLRGRKRRSSCVAVAEKRYGPSPAKARPAVAGRRRPRE